MSERFGEKTVSAWGSRKMQPSKAAVTRASILDAGAKFVSEKPFRELTVAKLMAETRSSRATFYLYFNDLHGLMEALLDEVKVGIIEGAQAWLSYEGDPATELQVSLRALVDVAFEHGAILKAVSDAAAGDDRLEAVWNAFLKSFDEVVAARIAHDQKAGITPEFAPFPCAEALNRMDAALLIHAFGTQEKADKDEVFQAICRVWTSTLYPFDFTAATSGQIKTTQRPEKRKDD